MNTKNTGGPAFPTDPGWFEPATVDEGKRLAGGMTLRDYFAAKALPGLMARNWEHMQGRDAEIMAVWVASSYHIADLMLAKREEK